MPINVSHPKFATRNDERSHANKRRGATNHQVFCPECASPLYSTSLGDGPKVLNLRLGTARQRDQLQPKVQY